MEGDYLDEHFPAILSDQLRQGPRKFLCMNYFVVRQLGSQIQVKCNIIAFIPNYFKCIMFVIILNFLFIRCHDMRLSGILGQKVSRSHLKQNRDSPDINNSCK